ncbi:MAG: antibiotic biosynthesis monooxygenase [Actinobacteria bacterium]|nr:antibiotic biosynthesis monooxygenase [Actinomycetota bacterium]MBV8479585.1 antibiotic biosynthesis monooxygenase [Actinomycetota bacterium]
MIALVFSYEVRERDAFERAYGADGEWADFFRQGAGYIGTELLRDVETPGRYLVVDRWESAEAYNAFAAANRDEYMRRVDDTRFYYDQELRFGTFETVWGIAQPGAEADHSG